MKSSVAGKNTARKPEVTAITGRGVWLLAGGREYVLPYDRYPWFQEAPVSSVLRVTMPHPGHLSWPSLDIDLELDCLEHPEQYPVVFD